MYSDQGTIVEREGSRLVCSVWEFFELRSRLAEGGCCTVSLTEKRSRFALVEVLNE